MTAATSALAAMRAMPIALRRWIDTWLYQLRGPQPGPIVLGHRRVYILPTSHGCIFFLVLLLMLAGSVNYSLSLGFILTFLLAGLGVNGMLYTFRNMANLRISAGRPRSVFAGDVVEFPLRIENATGVSRAALEAVSAAGQAHGFDVAADSDAVAPIALPARSRGRLRIGRVMLQTRFPLGLFRAWSYLEPDVDCIVFARPETPPVPLPSPTGERGEGPASALGNEDFSGLRAYHAGDSPRRIAWKADAQNRGLLSKVFSGQADSELWLDWNALPEAMATEARISRLTRWVLEADAAGMTYGLRLPPTVIEPAAGAGHRTQCLEALALLPQ
ncbi:MAG: DUF58 domain-containing protein [Betaproteobacteria bacterium]|nr:DUF58 domain-containing protein [Betaproteobacteria bacterium]